MSTYFDRPIAEKRYDALIGIYNKTKFFDATRKMIGANCGENFVFLRVDVDRFQLINSFLVRQKAMD